MKRLLLSTLLLMVTAFSMQNATASIVKGTITKASNYQGSIDFNNDGTAEFYFSSATGYGDVELANCVLQFSYSGGHNIWTAGNLEQGGWDQVKGLGANTSIGATSNWESQGDAYLVDMFDNTPFITTTDFCYIGFQIKINGNKHYGWAKVRLTASTQGYTADWIECAYETTPGKSIAAGALGVGIAENPNTSIRLYPNPTTDFVTISGSTDNTVAVYDFNGRQVNAASEIENDSTILDLRTLAAGTYFVKVNDTTIKVVLK